jgi:hypothetical protein
MHRIALVQRFAQRLASMKPETYGRVAGALFAAEAVFPIVHRALGGRYAGYTHGFDVVIDAGLAVVWCASAVAGFVQRPPQTFFVMFTGALVTFVHFVMYSNSTGYHGPYAVSLPWLALFPVQMFCVVRAAPAFFAPRAEPASEREARPEGTSRRWWPRRPSPA